MHTCKHTLPWVYWGFAASVQQPGALLHLRRLPESTKLWSKICRQLQQPCADKLNFAWNVRQGAPAMTDVVRYRCSHIVVTLLRADQVFYQICAVLEVADMLRAVQLI